jgi:drug/metabolite transporter (DMT)-like permease
MLSLFPSLLAFSWMNTYQPYVTAIQAAVIYTLEPVFVSAWAFFLPAILTAFCGIPYANETLTIPMVVGGGLIIAANFLALAPPGSLEVE